MRVDSQIWWQRATSAGLRAVRELGAGRLFGWVASVARGDVLDAAFIVVAERWRLWRQVRRASGRCRPYIQPAVRVVWLMPKIGRCTLRA